MERSGCVDRATPVGNEFCAGPGIDGDPSVFVQSVVSAARHFLDLDVAFIGEFVDDLRVFRYVDSRNPDLPVQVGRGDPLENTYCQRVVDGRLPGFISDASTNAEAMTLPATSELPVAVHLSVPIRLSDGSVYGTFCSFGRERHPSVGPRDLDYLRLLASLLAQHLEREKSERVVRREESQQVLDVIQNETLTSVYQPIVELRTNQVVGYEALTRFDSGTPVDWFAMATRTGQAVPLEIAAIDSAVRSLPPLGPDLYLAVNISAETLCSKAFGVFARGLPLPMMVLELTEQTLVESYPDLLARVAWLRSCGARIAIDDVGAGYSGLHRIVTVAPDIVKLDRALISGIDSDRGRQSLARAMSWYTNRSGNRLIAEGIETPAELHRLIALGVRYGQGYLLGRPAATPTVAARPVRLPAQTDGLSRQGRTRGGTTAGAVRKAQPSGR